MQREMWVKKNEGSSQDIARGNGGKPLAILWQWPSSATYLESRLTSWATTFSNLPSHPPSYPSRSLNLITPAKTHPPQRASGRLARSARETAAGTKRTRTKERDASQEIGSNGERHGER